MKKLLATISFGCLISFCALAAAASSPWQIVQDTAQQTIQVLRANRAAIKQDPRKVYDLIDQILLPHFDFKVMSEWVLGLNWRKATPQQRQRFTHEFQTLLVDTYAKALRQYSNEEVIVEPMRPGAAKSNQAIVSTRIEGGRGAPIHIDYHMLREGDDWKVYDLVIEHMDLVINYRDSFSEQIQNEGLDGLIASLAKHNSEFKIGD